MSPRVSRGAGKLHTGSKAWRRVRARVLERDAGVCQLRLPGRKVVADEVDHVVPRELGGALYARRGANDAAQAALAEPSASTQIPPARRAACGRCAADHRRSRSAGWRVAADGRQVGPPCRYTLGGNRRYRWSDVQQRARE
jgi:5-methylcytosine-specific restriction endonuclease McrA